MAVNAAPNTLRFPAVFLLLKGCLPPGKLHLISTPENRDPPSTAPEPPFTEKGLLYRDQAPCS